MEKKENKFPFTETEILNYISKELGVRKSRKRTYVDKRNYIIGILYYAFDYIEEDISKIIGIERSSVSLAKNKPYFLLNIEDQDFLKNTKKLRKRFPYNFPKKKILKKERIRVNIRMTLDFKRKLNDYAKHKNLSLNEATKQLMRIGLLIFEDSQNAKKYE